MHKSRSPHHTTPHPTTQAAAPFVQAALKHHRQLIYFLPLVDTASCHEIGLTGPFHAASNPRHSPSIFDPPTGSSSQPCRHHFVYHSQKEEACQQYDIVAGVNNILFQSSPCIWWSIVVDVVVGWWGPRALLLVHSVNRINGVSWWKDQPSWEISCSSIHPRTTSQD